MPELPEIEIIRQELSRDIVGLKVKAAAVTTGKTVKRHKTAKAFRDLLEGRTIKSVGRLGTSLVMELDDGSSLVIDAKESGQIRRAKSAKEAKAKHTSVVLSFTKSGQLRFADPKGAGEMYVSTLPAEGTVTKVSPASTVAMGGEGAAMRQRVPELAGLGFDRHRAAGSVDADPDLPGRSDPGDRHWGHLRRRDLLRCRPATRSGDRLAVHDRGAATVALARRDPG